MKFKRGPDEEWREDAMELLNTAKAKILAVFDTSGSVNSGQFLVELESALESLDRLEGIIASLDDSKMFNVNLFMDVILFVLKVVEKFDALLNCLSGIFIINENRTLNKTAEDCGWIVPNCISQ